MKNFTKYFHLTFTYKIFKFAKKSFFEFLATFGEIGIQFVQALKSILKLNINFKQVVIQSSKFAIDSLPITLTIVGMTTMIISIQVAPEMIKQGGGNYIGMLVAIVMIRELANVMAGFAIISMIGSSYASEIATMKVTDQIDALTTLKVDPIEYLFVPRLVASFVMMPFVVTFAAFIGLISGGIVVTSIRNGISWTNYIESIWLGLEVKDIMIGLFKASVFGFAISIVSLSCGKMAQGGAKEVGMATTKAVVWSFVTIAVIDYIFALIFYM